MEVHDIIQEAVIKIIPKKKNLPANTGNIRDLGLIPRSGRYPGVGNGNRFQYACLENPMGRGAWWSTVHGVARLRHNLATKLPPTMEDMLFQSEGRKKNLKM